MTVESHRAPGAAWRALAATVLIMSGAISAHTWAGGHVPALPGLVLLAGVVLGASMLLLRGSVSLKLLLPGVMVAQALLHTSFVATVGHSDHAAEMTAAASPWTFRMLVAHTAVTLLTVLVWRLCERAAHIVVRLLSLWTAYAGGSPDPRPALRGSRPAPTPTVVLTAPRRGPPLVTGRA